MKSSTNYGLKLMESTDPVTASDFYSNFSSIDSKIKEVDNKHAAYGSTLGTNTYTVSITGVSSYYDGLKVTIKIGTTSTGASTININSLGAKTILDSLGNAITSGGLKAGLPYEICYNGTNFILLGKGSGGTATADKILTGYNATVDSGQISGTMANQGAISSSLNAGGSYTVPAGYHNGSGKVTANSLASQTSATATVDKILISQTAWVNGSKITGTMANQGAVTSSLNAGSSYTVPAGYHSGSGVITANSLSSQTSATATAAQILSGQTAWVGGTKLTGTMTNKDAITGAISVVESGTSIYVRTGRGAYLTNASSGYPEISVADSALATALGITSSKIVSGNTIANIAGSATVSSLGGVTMTRLNILLNNIDDFGFNSAKKLVYSPYIILAPNTLAKYTGTITFVSSNYYTGTKTITLDTAIYMTDIGGFAIGSNFSTSGTVAVKDELKSPDTKCRVPIFSELSAISSIKESNLTLTTIKFNI